MALLIKNMTRRPTPRVPFAQAAAAVLPDWEISLVFIGEKRARDLNQSLRKKGYTPNVLSYTVGQNSGEVIVCPVVAERQASEFSLSTSHFELLLFIHGLLHLKGVAHSATMEGRERALLARLVPSSRALRTTNFPLTHGQTHRNGHRHRHLPGEARRRRRSH